MTGTTCAVSLEAFESLATLQRLSLQAGLSENLRQLTFRMLNHTVACCRYDRAVLWSFAGDRARLLGVSGNVAVNRRGPLADEWRRLVATLTDRDVPPSSAPNTSASRPSPGTSSPAHTRPVSYLAADPRRRAHRRRTLAGALGRKPVSESDLSRLESLALGYGVAWRSVAPGPRALRGITSSRKWLIAVTLGVVLAMALCFIKVPLRIVAPCEVVPRDPVSVAAPLQGVIDEVLVLPGSSVRAGDLLAAYDKRVALEELNVARQQVQIIEADLQRVRVLAFTDAGERAEITLLENRLEQEKTRLRVAQHRVDQLDIRAPVAGTLMFADPHEWRGRPVQVGESLMMIVDPARTKLRVWLPEHDNICFDRNHAVTVILDSDPASADTPPCVTSPITASRIGTDCPASAPRPTGPRRKRRSRSACAAARCSTASAYRSVIGSHGGRWQHSVDSSGCNGEQT